MIVESLRVRVPSVREGYALGLSLLWIDAPVLRPRLLGCTYGCGSSSCWHRASEKFRAWELEMKAAGQPVHPTGEFLLGWGRGLAQRELLEKRRSHWRMVEDHPLVTKIPVTEHEARALLAGDSSVLAGAFERLHTLDDATWFEAMVRRVFQLYFDHVFPADELRLTSYDGPISP